MPLNITTHQLMQLNSVRDCEFVDGIAQYLVGRFRLDAQPGFEHGSLANEIKKIVAQADELGLPRYDGYALHVLAAFILGVDYHEMPPVESVLHSKNLSGGLKALWLDRWFYSLEAEAAVMQARC